VAGRGGGGRPAVMAGTAGSGEARRLRAPWHDRHNPNRRSSAQARSRFRPGPEDHQPPDISSS